MRSPPPSSFSDRGIVAHHIGLLLSVHVLPCVSVLERALLRGGERGAVTKPYNIHVRGEQRPDIDPERLARLVTAMARQLQHEATTGKATVVDETPVPVEPDFGTVRPEKRRARRQAGEGDVS